jgi:hypothetical protein
MEVGFLGDVLKKAQEKVPIIGGGGSSFVLSTAAYHHGFCDKYDLMDFLSYRVRYQKYQPFADQFWLGYQIGFGPLAKSMTKHKKAAELMFQLLVHPWHKYILWRSKRRPFSTSGYIINAIIQSYSIVSYLIHPKRCTTLKVNLKGKSILDLYKHIIKDK